MLDESRSRPGGWAAVFQLGGHSYGSALLFFLAGGFATLWCVPFFTYLFGRGRVAPLVVALLWFSVLLLSRRWFIRAHKHPLAGDAALLEYFAQQNNAHPGEEEMATELMENALQLKAVRAHDCMAPRPEIVYIDADEPVRALQALFMESSMSRILVVGGELDNVLGYVHVQQLFNRPERIRDIVLPISFVPETIAVNDLLYKLIRTRTSIACVVDEYGSIAGLVTLEDALEQLFGQIDDEHDQEEFIEAIVSDTEFIFSGRLKVDYLNEKYPVLKIPPGEYHTLSGYLVTTTQTIPERGARLELDGKVFILELVSDRKIETVRVLL